MASSDSSSAQNVSATQKSSVRPNNKSDVHAMHYAIAEHGKLCALKSDHKDALKHYREAIRMAVSLKAPEVFFRHYTQCVLESLEQTDSYDEVIEFCENADAHHQKLALSSQMHKKDHASVFERWGVNLIKSGQQKEGVEKLKHVGEISDIKQFPITHDILAWAQRGYAIEATRILSLQRKQDYFVVRRGQVNAKLARSLASLKAGPINPVTMASPDVMI